MFCFRIVLLITVFSCTFSYSQTEKDEKLNKLVTQFEEELLFSFKKASKTATIILNEAKNKHNPSCKALVNYIKAQQLLAIDKKPNEAKIFAKKAYALHEKIKDSVFLFRDIHTIYECYVAQKKYDSAVYYATKELELAKKINIPSYRATANLAMGDVYYWTRQHDKVMKYRKEALRIANKYQLKKVLVDVHSRMIRSYVIPSNQRTKNVLDSAIYHGKKIASIC